MKKNNEKVKTGYYNAKTIAKFHKAYCDALQAVENGSDLKVRISKDNSKMGSVASVSLLPFLTCPTCCKHTCGKDCYAAKIANLYPTVLKSYAINTAIAINNPAEYWKQVNQAMKGFRFFRFHVAGDILNRAYFAEMIKAAQANPHTEILVFTKKYDIVNNWIDNNGDLPENLHILFSGWENLDPVNPHNLPETNVLPKNATENDLARNQVFCGGNCFECACRGVGCWQAKKVSVSCFTSTNEERSF